MAVNALYLDDWTVEKVQRSKEGYRLVARYDVEPDHCPKCGSTRQPYRHGPRAIDYVDAPVHGQRTVVAVDVQRYRCRDCSATFMQPLPDMDPQRRMTRRCVDHIREQGLIRPYAHLAREIGLDEKTIRDICNEEIEALLARHKPVAPVALGIDELHLLGRKRTIFTDVGERRILDLIESMNRPQVDRWLSLLEDRKRIRIVTIDMWGPYREAVKALLPDAVIISDKWHVQSKANAALDVIRNRQRRSAKGKDRRNPWRARRLLHAHGRNLSPQRAFVLDGMLKNNELLSMAWHTKEAFYDIWGGANRPSRHEAETMFDRWKADIPDEVSEFRAVAKTIDGWREQVFAYFEHPYTNAYTEAANGLIKIANRAGRGYRFDAIRAKAISIEPRVPVNLFVCETVTALELQPSGKYKPVTRFAEFVNVPELIAMFRSFADVVSADDLKKLVKRPRLATGQRQIITAPASPMFKSYQKVLDGRIKAIEARTGQPKKGDDILLSVITDGRHAAIDLRFVLPGCPDEPENKLNKLIANAHRIYVETSDRIYKQPDGTPYDRPGATQMIFSDLGTLSVEEKRGFSAYRWIKDQLILKGVPADEIAFVQDHKSTQAKNRLFADMRAGKVRFVIGSTKMMGTGVNAQNRLVAEHHLDVPYLPSDIEQREGRIDRQGNQNEEIMIFAYATEGSMDATMWQMNERKAKFIAAALSGDRSIRRLEDVGEDAVNQFAMAKAIASGDPRLMNKAGLESEISRLQRLRDQHYNEQHMLRSKVRDAERMVEESTRKLAIVQHDLTMIGDGSAPFVMTVGGSDFTERKDAGKALTSAMRDLDYAATSKGTEGIKQRCIATYRNCRIVYSTRYLIETHYAELEILTSGLTYKVNTKSNTPGATAIGQIEDCIDSFANMRERLDGTITYYANEQIQMRSRIGLEFALEGELLLKREELEAINDELKRDEEAEAEAAKKAAAEAGETGDLALADPTLTDDDLADDDLEDDGDASDEDAEDEADGPAPPVSPWLRTRFLEDGDAA